MLFLRILHRLGFKSRRTAEVQNRDTPTTTTITSERPPPPYNHSWDDDSELVATAYPKEKEDKEIALSFPPSSKPISDPRSTPNIKKEEPAVSPTPNIKKEEPTVPPAPAIYTNFHVDLHKIFRRRIPDEPSHSIYSGVLASNTPQYTSDHLSLRRAPQPQEELFTRPADITVASVSQWLWTQDQCRAWIKAVLLEYFAFTHSRAEATSKKFTGAGGRELYLLSAQTWKEILDFKTGWVQHPVSKKRKVAGDVGSELFLYEILHCTSCRREVPDHLWYWREKRRIELKVNSTLKIWPSGPKTRSASI